MAHRLQSFEVLENPFRQALLDTIREHPGVAFVDLFRYYRADPWYGLGLGYGSLLHHLHKLEWARVITTRKSGRHRRYYVNGGPWGSHCSAVAVLQTPTAGELARIVWGEPGSHLNRVHERFRTRTGRRMTRQAVGYQLQRLVAFGLATLYRDGSKHVFHPTPLLERLLGYAGPPAPPLRDAAPVAVPVLVGVTA